MTAGPHTCRFSSIEEVEVLARVARQWDEDGQPEAHALDLGELILKVGNRLVVLKGTQQGCSMILCRPSALHTQSLRRHAAR